MARKILKKGLKVEKREKDGIEKECRTNRKLNKKKGSLKRKALPTPQKNYNMILKRNKYEALLEKKRHENITLLTLLQPSFFSFKVLDM